MAFYDVAIDICRALLGGVEVGPTVTGAPASYATKVVGPDRYRPPRHRMPRESRHQGSNCFG
jgi:hypothetical protein